MDTSTSPMTPAPRSARLPSRWLAASLAVAALVAFLALAPGGLLEKSEAVGKAVCGRIDSHTFVIAGRLLELFHEVSGVQLKAAVGCCGN